jgi:hypothetical protein
LVLDRPTSFALQIEPPIDPFGQRWRIALHTRGSSRRGEASEEGIWSTSELSPGDYTLMVSDSLDSHWAREELRLDPGDESIRVDVPVVPVRGTVRRGDEPVLATLWFGGASSGGVRIRFDTDREGAFEGYLPREGEWPVEIAEETSGLRLALDPVDIRRPDGKQVADVEVAIPDTKLPGEVVDELGRAVPEAIVETTSFQDAKGRPRRPSRFRSDAEGKFEIRGLPTGPTAVQARLDERASDWAQVALPEGREGPYLKLVLRRDAELRGRLLSANGPVPGAVVSAFPEMSAQPVGEGVEDVTGPDGSFMLRLPAGSPAATLLVMAPGFALRMARVTLDSKAPLEITAEAGGGTLVLETGQRFDQAGRPFPMTWLVHDGTFTSPYFLQRWPRLLRHDPGAQPEGTLVLPQVMAGYYALCAGSDATRALRQGQEAPVARCSGGFLAPHGQLTLRVPP